VTVAKKLNCPYCTATDGKQAVDSYIATNGSFDIIFMDIQMPNMDGLAASLDIRTFEQQSGLKRTPIIAVTGLASAKVQEQAIISGIDSLLTKPVPMKTLRTIIEEHFSQT
jgi:CheY-like chemotaxis protein